MNRAEPANFADLEDDVRYQLDFVPENPYPQWLATRLERQRYPMLHNAVQTSWHRDSAHQPTLTEALIEHTTRVLTASFRRKRGLEGKLGSLLPAPDLKSSCVQRDALLTIDGVNHRAALIDTDPHVFAIGSSIDDTTFVTVVVTRDELAHVRIELETRPPQST